jgi:hypothetical protein
MNAFLFTVFIGAIVVNFFSSFSSFVLFVSFVVPYQEKRESR